MSSSSAKARTRSLGAVWFPIVLALILAVVWITISQHRTDRYLADARRIIAEDSVRLAASDDFARILTEPGTREIPFTTGTGGPRGRVLLNPTAGLAVAISQLPAPPAGQHYHCWLLVDTGSATSLGSLPQNLPATFLLAYPHPPELTRSTRLAFTRETTTTATVPTSRPVFEVLLSDTVQPSQPEQ